MDFGTISMLYSAIRLVGGFFDFVVFIGLMVVALAFVKKADATLGYVLAAAASVRFLLSCCLNVSTGLSEQMGEVAGVVGIVLSSISLFVDLGMWGTVLFVLYSLAAKLAPSQG